MTALKTFCDIDNNIVGYAISAVTSSVDPVTCVASFGLQAEYYDTDFNVLGSSLPAGWGECCCGGSETVTTLTEDALNRTATYTNEIGAMTVLSETDFTANSQTIPGTCEGVLPDADVKRELPVRWHAASNTYKAYDDGKTFVVSDQSLPTGNGVFGNVTNANDGDIISIQTVSITNPSSCKSMLARYYATGSDFHFGLIGIQVATEFGIRSQISVNGSPFANYAPFGGDDCGYFCTVAVPAPGKYNWAMAGHTENFVIPPSGVLTISIRKVLFVATPAPIYFESDGRSVTLVGVTI